MIYMINQIRPKHLNSLLSNEMYKCLKKEKTNNMKDKKMVKKGLKQINVTEDLHSQIAILRIVKKLKSNNDAIHWMYDTLKQLGKV